MSAADIVHDEQRITLAHGGGGELTRQLVADRIVPRLANAWLAPLADSAVLPRPGADLCFTTDAFVVQPLEFPGGDIGRLAVCGTVNDLAVMGAVPTALSLALIIEEGLPLTVLDRILDSLAAAAREAGVVVATGDTKVVEHGRGDGLMIATAGVGERRRGLALDARRLAPGDALIVTGTIAEHGLAVMSAREGLTLDTDLRSDVAPLNGLISALLATGADIKFMRDPTRGGLAGVLADLSDLTGLSLEIEESAVPVSATARATAELLGLDPLTIANEGKCLIVASATSADAILAACRRHPLGRAAAVIGQVTGATPALVELRTRIGGRRILPHPYGEELPRIC